MRLSPFAYGFRPNFLAAGLAAAVLVPLWVGFVFGAFALELRWAPVAWHAHELLFGFVAAAIAGFLLTAVPSWTGERGFAGRPLVALAALWLAGRLAPFAPPAVPEAAIAAVDVLFLPAVAALVAPALQRTRNRNRVLLVVLAALTACNVGYHWAMLQDDAALALRWLHATVNLAVLLTAIIGGRIVPAFTNSGLKPFGIAGEPALSWLEAIAIGSLVAIVFVDLAWPASLASGILAAIAGFAHLVRAARWRPLATWRVPLVWVLHVGYAWIPIGLLLKATFLLTGAPFAAFWVHALAAGALATMILAVMTRASLGHTGRELRAPRPIIAAYGSLTLGVVLRVFGVTLGLDYDVALVGAAALWTLAFGLFVAVYAPILLRPRVDGRPG